MMQHGRTSWLLSDVFCGFIILIIMNEVPEWDLLRNTRTIICEIWVYLLKLKLIQFPRLFIFMKTEEQRA